MDFDIWKFLAGLGAFLLSINLVEDALKMLGSRSFKLILRKHTNNHFKSILVGATSTAILQSSSAVTLMLLALVGSGIINLSNALGIVLGANLGTTFTGWIVSTLGFKVDINTAIYPIMAVGSLIYAFFPSRPKLFQWGKFLFGLGFLFFGLNMMKDSMAGLQSQFNPTDLANYHYLIFALAGAIFTAIIQSSSASMTITLTALNAGLIPLEGACALMVGADLGTTMTVVLGSSAGGHLKKQVAAAHFFFNLVTDIITLIILIPLLKLVTALLGAENPLYILVTFYSLFNLIGITIFVPFLNNFARLLQKKFPAEASDKEFKIDTSLPEAAIINLFEFAKSYLNKTYQLNLSALTNLSGNYLKNYDGLKLMESSLIDNSVELGQKSLSKDQSYWVKQIQASARNCSYSMKSIKDIIHNFDDFRNSTNSNVVNLSSELIENYKNWMKEFKEVTAREEISPTLFETIMTLSQGLEKIHRDFLSKVNKMVAEKSVELKHVPNLFNANRELFSSCNALVEAFADLVLSEQQNQDYSQIPRNID